MTIKLLSMLKSCARRWHNSSSIWLKVIRFLFHGMLLFILHWYNLSSLMGGEQQGGDNNGSSSFEVMKNPVSFPILSLEDLKSKAYVELAYYEFIRASTPLAFSDMHKVDNDHRKLMVVHDMKNGYLDDRFVQGGQNPDAYTFWHWHLIDIFVYFSHNLVTVPPVSWINAAHKHGVKVLGTFIMEGNNLMDPTSRELLSSEENARMYAKRLAELAKDLGFDGWLINVELLIVPQVDNLKKFVSYLTDEMHSAVNGSLVIWYESVTEDGVRGAQNELNKRNKSYFDRCDGIYINYGWKKNHPKKSSEVAGDRKFDVYMGIDVFGRHGTYGDGKWNIGAAVDVVKNANVSVVIFAPGWVHETNQLPNFQASQNLLWHIIGNAWKVGELNPKPLKLPLHSNFDQGRGFHISVEGRQVSSAPWNCLSSQSFQPDLEFKNTDHDPIHALVNLERESYSGGGNLVFSGNLGDTAVSTTRLFRGKLHITEPLHLTYSVILKGNSQLGVYFSMEDGTKVLVAPLDVNRFSGEYGDVVKPDESKEGKWVIREGRIDRNGKVLREIRALSYKNGNSGNEYEAVLGHISLKTSNYNSNFPPSDSWDVQCDPYHLALSECSRNNKTNHFDVDIKVSWKLTGASEGGSNDPQFSQYNIYVVRENNDISGGLTQEEIRIPQYLGATPVNAFYVSKLSIPHSTTGLKFIVQVCGMDGACQPLNDSPNGIYKFH